MTLQKWLVFFVLLVAGFGFAEQELWDTAQGRERIFNALVDTFKDNYWDETYLDWDDWANDYRDNALEAESREDFDRTLRRMVNVLNDDHSRWVGRLGQLGLTDSFEETLDQPLGLGIQHNFASGIGLVVERVFVRTPAEDAGLMRADVIVSINGQSLKEISGDFLASSLLTDAVSAGPIDLMVLRRSTLMELRVTPAVVNFAAVRDLPQGNMLDETTAYIYLPSFDGAGIAQELHDLVAELQSEGAESLVLDLRDNPGGRLSELGLVLGAFVEGPWVDAFSRGDLIWRSRYRSNDGQGINVLENGDGRTLSSDRITNPASFAGPLAIIVSKRNSSAGEIGPMVLKEFGRATIVGETTDGNVEAIRTFDLPDGSLVYVAVANLQGIQGTDFSLGLEPDVQVKSSSLRDLARGFDEPVAEALKALKELPFTPGKFF